MLWPDIYWDRIERSKIDKLKRTMAKTKKVAEKAKKSLQESLDSSKLNASCTITIGDSKGHPSKDGLVSEGEKSGKFKQPKSSKSKSVKKSSLGKSGQSILDDISSKQKPETALDWPLQDSSQQGTLSNAGLPIQDLHSNGFEDGWEDPSSIW